MNMASLEAAILAELREVSRSIRKKDIMEWSTGTVKVGPGEKLYFLPNLKVNVAVLASAVEPKKKGRSTKEVK